MKCLVLLTDMKDVAVSEVVLRSIPRELSEQVNVSVVNIETFDTVHANFLLRLVLDSLEMGDIVSIVCDPRLNDIPRDSIGIELENGVCVVGPNNGVMSRMLEDFNVKTAIKLPISPESTKHPTFNGKYRFAVATKKLLLGEDLSSIGEVVAVDHFYKVKTAHGTVVHVDNYGNLKLKLPRIEDKKVGSKVLIKLRDKIVTVTYGVEFDDVDEGEGIFYNGSSLWGLPELALNRGSFASTYGVRVGDFVTIMGER